MWVIEALYRKYCLARLQEMRRYELRDVDTTEEVPSRESRCEPISYAASARRLVGCGDGRLSSE